MENLHLKDYSVGSESNQNELESSEMKDNDMDRGWGDSGLAKCRCL